MVKNHPKLIGELSEARILYEFLKNNIVVSKPFGDCCSYDFIIEINKNLYKIQCKTARDKSKNVSLIFKTKSLRFNKNNNFTSSYRGKIDFFAVYFPKLDKIYLVHESFSNDTETLILRYGKTHNTLKVLKSEDFEIQKVLKRI